MNTNSNTMVMNDANQAQITATFTKKILAHLDDPDSNKLAQFVQLFNPNNCRIIFNATPFAQATVFLQMWQNQVVQTQHALTGVDYSCYSGIRHVDMQRQLQSQIRRKRQRQDGARRDSSHSTK